MVTLSAVGAEAKPIAAIDLEFAAGTLSQQNAGGALNTTFQDNNGVIPLTGGQVNRDTQWLFSSTQLTTANGTRGNGHGFNSEGASWLSGVFGFVPTSSGGPGNIPVGTTGRPIAQLVLPSGESATYSGQVSYDDGSFVNVSGVVPAPEPAGLGFLTVAATGLVIRRRQQRN